MPGRVTLVGEAMLELSDADGGAPALSCAGDAFNTAVHMSRMGADVSFLSAVGADAFSGLLRRRCREEGIDDSLILTDPDRTIGLYAITLDELGERSFVYWRSDSAARRMFSLPESAGAIASAELSDVLFFSLISLAILPADDRKQLLSVATKVRRRGGVVAFDGNYRPKLWSSRAEARTACSAAIAVATIGLPGFDDESDLFGATDAGEIASRWTRLGCDEVIVKLGAGGCLLPDGRVIAPPQAERIVDTSGAGDAFNAGYLVARMQGEDEAGAARRGHAVAVEVIAQRGATPPRRNSRQSGEASIVSGALDARPGDDPRD